MAGKSSLFAVALVFRHNCNEPLSTENIFTDTKMFCKSVFVCFCSTGLLHISHVDEVEFRVNKSIFDNMIK